MPEPNIPLANDIPTPVKAEVLNDDEQAFEKWLRDVVVPECEAFKADPSIGRSVEEVRAALAAKHARYAKRQ